MFTSAAHPGEQHRAAGVATLRFPLSPDSHDAQRGARIGKQDVLVHRLDAGAGQRKELLDLVGAGGAVPAGCPQRDRSAAISLAP